MTKSTATQQPRRPGRKPSLNVEHTTVLRSIVQEQPRASLDEVTRELLRRSGVKVNPVTVRKALREAGIERLKPVRRAAERAAQGRGAGIRTGYTDAHRRSDGASGLNTDLTDAEWALVGGSTLAAACCARAAPGACCPRAFHHGKPSTCPSSVGAVRASSR